MAFLRRAVLNLGYIFRLASCGLAFGVNYGAAVEAPLVANWIQANSTRLFYLVKVVRHYARERDWVSFVDSTCTRTFGRGAVFSRITGDFASFSSTYLPP